MKKTVLMFAAAALMLATPSCKKGENDPFLSLRSRKARVAGAWNLSAYMFSSLNTESDGDTQATEAEYSDGVITYDYSYYDSNSGTTTSNSTTVTVNEASYTFEKDGTWSSTMDLTTVSEDTYTDFLGDQHTVTTTTNSVETTTGIWSFAGKVKDEFKKKERLILNTLAMDSEETETEVDNNDTDNTSTTTSTSSSSTDEYSNGEIVNIYEIDQLKNKEMIWKTDEENTGTSSFTDNSGTTTTTNDDVYTSEEWITFNC